MEITSLSVHSTVDGLQFTVVCYVKLLKNRKNEDSKQAVLRNRNINPLISAVDTICIEIHCVQ